MRGRLFGEQDGANAPHAAVISESLARARWPDADPIGAQVNQAGMDGDFRPLTIIGIVGDVRERGLDAEPRPTFYADYRQWPLTTFNFTFVLHTALPPASIVGAARTAISEVAPDIPPRFRTIEEVIGATVAGRRFALTLVGLFAAAAMLLAVVGVYGVLSYAVTQRRHEFGVRVALGASSQSVLGLVLRQATTVLVTGVLIGLVGAALASRVLQSMLFGITGLDAVTYTAVVLSLSAAGMVASLLPALRAARAEPLVVLRSEG